jgi:hypothetical protein
MPLHNVNLSCVENASGCRAAIALWLYDTPCTSTSVASASCGNIKTHFEISMVAVMPAKVVCGQTLPFEYP